jgi:sec-independent protein translocase protein TatB
MEILGIGAPELIFIVIIALIVLGPKDMQKAGKTIGRWLNDLVRSDGWKAFQQTSKEIRTLPNKLMREANMEMMEAEKDLRKVMDTTPKAPASPSNPNLPRVQGSENTIQPPPAKTPEAESKTEVETKTETGTDTDQHD